MYIKKSHLVSRDPVDGECERRKGTKNTVDGGTGLRLIPG